MTLRRYVKRYATGGKMRKGKKVDVLSVAEKQQMMRECENSSPALHEFLLYIDNDTNVASEVMEDLLLSLSSKSPVCSYIHVKPAVKTLIDDLSSGLNVKEDPVKWRMLNEEIPVLYKLLAIPSVRTVPQPLVSLLQQLWNKAEATFASCQPLIDSTTDFACNELAHFPCLPEIRRRGCFAADLSKTSKGAVGCKKRFPDIRPCSREYSQSIVSMVR
jgi:hypothetical protein